MRRKVTWRLTATCGFVLALASICGGCGNAGLTGSSRAPSLSNSHPSPTSSSVPNGIATTTTTLPALSPPPSSSTTSTTSSVELGAPSTTSEVQINSPLVQDDENWVAEDQQRVSSDESTLQLDQSTAQFESCQCSQNQTDAQGDLPGGDQASAAEAQASTNC